VVQGAALCLKVLDFLHAEARQTAVGEAAGTISIQKPGAVSLKAKCSLRPCQEKCEPNLAHGPQLVTSANQRQFLTELFRNCGFFAHLVFRQVRPKEFNVIKPSQTLPQAGLPRRLLVEGPGTPAETPSSLLQTLWVEVGCRQMQILVSEKERHDNGEDSKPAL
jgi:hypothetical protein